MRSSAPALFPLFRSAVQGELLAAVLLTDSEASVTDIARRLKFPVQTVQREVERLEQAGIFVSRRAGNVRLVQANHSSLIYEPLTELVLRTFGPITVLAREYADLAGVTKVEIFGSWAARYRGEPGAPPGDIDVLVVGEGLDRDDVFDAATRAQDRLGTPVNPVVITAERWEVNGDAFLAGLRDRPRVTVFDRTFVETEK